MSSIAQPVARSVSRSVLAGQRMNLGYLIRSMFSQGEQGFAYDFNDLTTLYQDAAGTIPVTGAGQPVGLVLDKSKGLVLGGEILKPLNDSSWAYSEGISLQNNTLVFNNAGNGASAIYTYTQPFAVGDWYVIEWDVTSYTSGGGLYVRVGGGNFFNTNPNTGHKKLILRVTVSNSIIQFAEGTGNGSYTIANLTVKKLSGNHAYQTTSASRPLLQRNATTGAYYLLFDGVDDSLVTNNIDFTPTDKISLFVGMRKLNDSTLALVVGYKPLGENGSFSLGLGYSNSESYSSGSRGTISSSAPIAKNAYPAYNAPSSAVVSTKAEISSDLNKLRLDSREVSSSTSDQGTGNYGRGQLSFGGGVGGQYRFNGHVYSLIGVGRLTTDAETIALEKAIAKNVGVTL